MLRPKQFISGFSHGVLFTDLQTGAVWKNEGSQRKAIWRMIKRPTFNDGASLIQSKPWTPY